MTQGIVKAYYNEIDLQKAGWLRELIRCEVVADGEVDNRSIKEVRAEELRGFAQCHFFAGIGVWSYALRLAGWPDERPVWTGSCPCPSFSAAGKGGGFNDPRHLWPDWARLVRECRPATLFGEQADDAIGYGWLDLVQTDLERENYAVGKAVLGACSVGAPHIRQRLYFVAHAEHAERWPKQEAHRNSHGRNGPGRRGDTRRMGEPDGTRSQPRESSATANGRWSSDLAASSTRELADAADARRQIAGKLRSRQSLVSARLEQHGGVGGLADADGRGLAMCGQSSEGKRDGEQFGADGGMGDTEGPAAGAGFTLRARQSDDRSSGHVNGFWRDADWILRKRWNRDDREWCPTEPGTFPLAHGIAARVLKLRGYGDAICAPLAAEFIRACESLDGGRNNEGNVSAVVA